MNDVLQLVTSFYLLEKSAKKKDKKRHRDFKLSLDPEKKVH
ncbi:hypothetical protein [Proteiniborus sp.]